MTAYASPISYTHGPQAPIASCTYGCFKLMVVRALEPSVIVELMSDSKPGDASPLHGLQDCMPTPLAAQAITQSLHGRAQQPRF